MRSNALVVVVIAAGVCYGMLAHDLIQWTRRCLWKLLCRAFRPHRIS